MPILLLNVDTKILSTAFAATLKPITSIIFSTQTAYVVNVIDLYLTLLKFAVTKIYQSFWWLWISRKLLIPWTRTFYYVLWKNLTLEITITWIKKLLNDQQFCVVNGLFATQYFTLKKLHAKVILYQHIFLLLL